MIRNQCYQIQTLENLRDMLLSKLLHGVVKINLRVGELNEN